MKYFRIRYKRGKSRHIEVIEALNRLEAIKVFSGLSLGVVQEIVEIPQPLGMKFKKFQEKWDDPIKPKRVKDLSLIHI